MLALDVRSLWRAQCACNNKPCPIIFGHFIRSAAACLLAMERENMTDFLLCFRDVTSGLQDGLRESPFAASVPEPSVDFFWRAKSLRPIQTIPGTAEQIRREVIPVGFGFADGLEQLPPLFAGTFCAVG